MQDWDGAALNFMRISGVGQGLSAEAAGAGQSFANSDANTAFARRRKPPVNPFAMAPQPPGGLVGVYPPQNMFAGVIGGFPPQNVFAEPGGLPGLYGPRRA